jgi:hypothetical protein
MGERRFIVMDEKEALSIYKMLYGALHTARSAELHAYWKRYSIFATVNFLFLGLSLGTFKDSKIMLLILFGFGLVLCFLWILVIHLSKRHIDNRWDHCIYNLEEKFRQKLGLEKEESSNYLPLIKARDFEHKPREESSVLFVRNWINMNYVALSLPCICAATWIIVTVIKSYEIFRSQKFDLFVLVGWGLMGLFMIFMFIISCVYIMKLLLQSK